MHSKTLFALLIVIRLSFNRYLVERGALALSLENSNIFASVQQCYGLLDLKGSGCNVQEYFVYSYLRKFGYIVSRHNVPWTYAGPRLKKSNKVINDNKGITKPSHEKLSPREKGRNFDLRCQNVSMHSKYQLLYIKMSLYEIIHFLLARECSGGDSQSLELKFDVYLPKKGFQKTNPGSPLFSLCIAKCVVYM